MATYAVTLVTPRGTQIIQCPDNQYILDVAEKNKIILPSSCRAGICGTCTGKLISGSVDQSEQSILEEEQIADGYVQLCVGYATSDCTIETHQSAP
ncbi:2Fe-2S iron-sulfur cluster-binding protein [Anthocerotibacter panamensis]|uniref:2Fe-2S iron-sulfur cluster-binding protein n=1 Tax=Anthocerotibacter panamensis TaxID=2857077 RepID=UPI001C40322B|nr:2Fe-2S iron-sulfur cluster-binding protein [Anthocerotibacter panamensis]